MELAGDAAAASASGTLEVGAAVRAKCAFNHNSNIKDEDGVKAGMRGTIVAVDPQGDFQLEIPGLKQLRWVLIAAGVIEPESTSPPPRRTQTLEEAQQADMSEVRNALSTPREAAE